MIPMKKEFHQDKICEAFYEPEKTWYAAIILDIFEAQKEVEIAWIGIKAQERLPQSYVTILLPPDEASFFEGATCSAIYPSDGMWYICQIEKVLPPEQGEDQKKYLVKFKQFNSRQTLPFEYLRISPEQEAQNLKR